MASASTHEGITEANGGGLVTSRVDRASGVEVCSTMLVMRTGAGWAFPCSDKKDAQESASAIREFLGLTSPTA